MTLPDNKPASPGSPRGDSRPTQYFHAEYTFWPDPHWSLLILDETGDPRSTYGPFATRQEAWEHSLGLSSSSLSDPNGAIRTSWVASW